MICVAMFRGSEDTANFFGRQRYAAVRLWNQIFTCTIVVQSTQVNPAGEKQQRAIEVQRSYVANGHKLTHNGNGTRCAGWVAALFKPARDVLVFCSNNDHQSSLPTLLDASFIYLLAWCKQLPMPTAHERRWRFPPPHFASTRLCSFERRE